jgi:hypothetical protein
MGINKTVEVYIVQLTGAFCRRNYKLYNIDALQITYKERKCKWEIELILVVLEDRILDKLYH